MLTLSGYLMNRATEYPVSVEMLGNANSLLNRVEALLYDLGIECDDEDIASGYRPGKYNVLAGGSTNSAHKLCLAVDLHETSERQISSRITEALLEKHGLYMESPKSTVKVVDGKTYYWCHLQTRPTRKRIFIP
jgi:hypothetical protein